MTQNMTQNLKEKRYLKMAPLIDTPLYNVVVSTLHIFLEEVVIIFSNYCLNFLNKLIKQTPKS